MICFMHEGNPYGHLKVGNKVILASNLCGMVGATLSDVEGWLDELSQAGVYGLADDGSMFSRRMIKDENLRNMRAAGGKLGGNPALKDKDKVNLKDKQNPTPSSSSSSSSSSSLNTVSKDTVAAKAPSTKRGKRLQDDWKLPKHWGEWALIEFQHWTADIVRLESDKFADHWRSKTGKDAAKLDWEATWRNWCRSDIAQRSHPVNAKNNQQKTFAERDREAGWARWEEQTGRIHPDRQKAQGHVIDVNPTFLEIEQ